jgi:GNAT superfamily N-acetyltransferase
MKKTAAKFLLRENDLRASDMQALNELLKQLNPEANEMSHKKVKEVMRHGVIVSLRDAKKENSLIGMGTLLPLRKLFAFCGSIEDVVVSADYRGQGLGKKIMQTLLDKGKSLGIEKIDLTSSPKRKIANILYQSLGFEKRKTNIYRFKNT